MLLQPTDFKSFSSPLMYAIERTLFLDQERPRAGRYQSGFSVNWARWTRDVELEAEILECKYIILPI